MLEPDFSKIFHQSSKDHQKGHPAISPNPETWPTEWKTVFYKDYPRLPKIELEKAPQAESILEIINGRKSHNNFSHKPITKKELSALLKYSCGKTGASSNNYHRAQPSAGARYPLEVYPIIFLSTPKIKSGVYHYNVRNHALDVLWDREFSASDIAKLFTYSWVKDAALALVITAAFERNQIKYGERGYRYILIEAGHVGQNIYLVSETLQLKCCALGGTKDKELEELISIDGITESVVYALAIGK